MRLIVFSLIAIVGLPSAGYSQIERLVIERAPNDPSRYICDVGFATFTTPKNWVPNSSDKNTYAILTHSKESYPNVTAMISIDIGKPVEPTAKRIAEAFAKKWSGQVLKSPIEIDGEKGCRVKIPPNNNEIRPVDCAVVVKDKRAFMLIGGAKTDNDTSEAIDDVIKTWKWKK